MERVEEELDREWYHWLNSNEDGDYLLIENPTQLYIDHEEQLLDQVASLLSQYKHLIKEM